MRVRVPGDLRRPFVFGLDLLEVAVRLVTPRAHEMRPSFEHRIVDPAQRGHHLRGRLADLGRRAVRDEMLDAAHEEPRPRDGVDAIQDRQQGRRRELEQLGGAIGLPQQRVHPTGRFDAPARVERVRLVETRPREIRRASDVTGQARGVGRVEQQRRVIDAGDRGRVVDGFPPAQRALVVVERGLEREALLRLLRRGDEPPQRRGRIASRVPVPRELRDAVDTDRDGRVSRERGRDRAVQRDALVGEQLVEHGLAQQRVPEVVARAVAPCDQQAAVDRRARRAARRVVIEPGGGGEPCLRRGRADDRGRPHEVATGFIERAEARQHEVTNRLRNAGRTERGHELLDEQRIPVGVVRDAPNVGRARVRAEQDLGHLGGRVFRERRERDLASREPCELGDQVALGGRVLGAVRDDEQDRHPAEIVGDVAEQLAARGIDPVQVVDHEDQPRA